MTETISSFSNPIIKHARALHQKKVRDESQQFLVEGILHVGEAVEANWDFEYLLYCEERLKSDFGRQLVAELIKRDVRCQPVSAAAFESFSEKENPQGIAAVIHQKQRRLSELQAFRFAVAIVAPQDPGNVGTILRTMDAVGADGLLLLDGGADPYHPSAVRASMGAIFWKPFYSATFADFVDWIKEINARLIATSAHATVDYRKVELDNRPTILLLGSEQKGLLPEQLAVCEEVLSLPMEGRATSLNLAVAAGIFMYALKNA